VSCTTVHINLCKKSNLICGLGMLCTLGYVLYKSLASNRPTPVHTSVLYIIHCISSYRRLLHDVVQKKINAELLVQKKVTNWEEIITVSSVFFCALFYSLF